MDQDEQWFSILCILDIYLSHVGRWCIYYSVYWMVVSVVKSLSHLLFPSCPVGSPRFSFLSNFYSFPSVSNYKYRSPFVPGLAAVVVLVCVFVSFAFLWSFFHCPFWGVQGGEVALRCELINTFWKKLIWVGKWRRNDLLTFVRNHWLKKLTLVMMLTVTLFSSVRSSDLTGNVTDSTSEVIVIPDYTPCVSFWPHHSQHLSKTCLETLNTRHPFWFPALYAASNTQTLLLFC